MCVSMCVLDVYGFYVSNEFNEFNNEFLAPICRASITLFVPN